MIDRRAAYNVSMNVTRRDVALLVAAAAVPGPAAPQAAADEETRSAQEALANNARQIDKIDLPMATEPAFQFKA